MSIHTRPSMRHDLKAITHFNPFLASHATAAVNGSGEECARSAAAYERITFHSLVVGLPDFQRNSVGK
jgi:hypothetical protein